METNTEFFIKTEPLGNSNIRKELYKCGICDFISESVENATTHSKNHEAAIQQDPKKVI